MVLLNNFNADDHQEDGNFDALPEGLYEVAITESEEKENSKGTGTYVKLTLQVISGQYANRLLWCNLNLSHPSQQAVEIAQKTLGAICRATGVLTPTDTSQLHHKPMIAKVIVKPKYNSPGEFSNEVKGFKSCDSTPQPQNAQPSVSGAAAPWER